MSSFICTGTTLVFFHISGNIHFFNDPLKITFKGVVTNSLQFFIILIDILSYPYDLLEFNDFIIDNISLFVTRKELILVLVLHKKGGNALLF